MREREREREGERERENEWKRGSKSINKENNKDFLIERLFSYHYYHIFYQYFSETRYVFEKNVEGGGQNLPPPPPNTERLNLVELC